MKTRYLAILIGAFSVSGQTYAIPVLDCVIGTPYTAVGAGSCSVPAGVTSINVVAKGAGGGSGDNGELGGNGGVVTVTLTVTPGQVLSFSVGGGGSKGVGPYKGGGGGGSTNIDAGTANQIIAGGGGGGGGGSSSGTAYKGGDGNGSAGSTASTQGGGVGGNGGIGGAGGAAGGQIAGNAGGDGNGGAGGASNGAGGAGVGTGTGGTTANSGGGGGGGFGGGGTGAGSAAFGQGAGGGGGGSVGPAGAVITVGTNGGGNPASNGGDGSIEFTNSAPTASLVTISGTAVVGGTLSGGYTYGDAENNPEGTSTFRWMRNTVNTGVGGGANVSTTQNYSPVVGDQSKFMYFCVTPIASAGTTTGAEVCSSATAAVAAANTAPTASAVVITGTAQVGVQLSGGYTYADADSDAQGTSTFRWVSNTVNTGVYGGTNVSTTQSYSPVTSDESKFMYFCVTPKALSGALSGTETCSSATLAVASAPALPTNPIPTVIPPPIVVGVGGNQLSPLNLSSGDGPAMTICLRDTLRDVIGANAVYQGQTANGGARIGQTGLIVSFYALEASTSTSGGSGIHLRINNPLNVVTSCGTFLTAPAVYNLSEWGSYLNGIGLAAQINSQGVMTVKVGDTIYVARPDYSVTQGVPGTPGLVTGSDGLLRFTDSAGNTQILYPAFLDPEVLSVQIALEVSGSTLIQTDGTALVTLLNGQQYVLTPDMTLGGVPAQFWAAGLWQDGPNHYRYRNSSFPAASQGFTVKPR